ncbi:MAG TPA: GGDEF domain-containing protein [Arthrobacter sp.]|nr:GGDEF domain-containing protein [Arthrobacter sp.]
MVLDITTLRVALGVVALTLLVLFYASFRRTRSAYNGWWCIALLFFLTGNSAFLLNGTPHQVWANPSGNALLVGGAFSVWAGARSLRMLPAPRWQLAAACAVTVFASLLDRPGTNTWSGGLAYLGFMTVGIGLASLDLWRLDSSYSHVHKSMAIAAGFLATYYFGRWVLFLAEGQSGPDFRLYFGPSIASLVTLVLLVAVSFSMTALSNDQLINGLSERAARDNLTGLLNRGTFLDLAAKELKRLQATGSIASLILADLDHFKAINDVYGHAAGDAALKAFADACTESVRATDVVGRYGGEEFILLLPGATQERAESIAADISRALAATESLDDMQLPTVSYGVASSPADAVDLTTMIAAADAALYEAKSLGRNRVVRAGRRA